jgi:hypothetical protein
MVKAAIEYYFDRQDAVTRVSSARQRDLMIGMLQGGVASRDELAAAVTADHAG